MARIVLGIGTSHTPMLSSPVEDMPLYVERDMGIDHLDRQGRPTTYAALLAAASPAVAGLAAGDLLAGRHARAQADIARLAQVIAAARLDALIVVGDDQKEVLDDRNLPPLLVYWGATIRNNVYHGRYRPEWLGRAAPGYFETDGPRDYPVHHQLARHVIDRLIADDFDVATANGLPDGMGEGHAFGFVHRRLLTGDPVPVVPVFLNTYYPPSQPTPRRCHDIGRAIRRAVEAYPEDLRVGIVASGGLSHFLVDEEFDRAIIDALRAHDADALRSLPVAKLNAGSSEIRNWVCVAGAVEHLSLDWVDYLPGYRTPAGTGTGICFAEWRQP